MSIKGKSSFNSISRPAYLALGSIALLLQGCYLNFELSGTQGSGVQTTESFDVESFDQVQFSGSGEYNITIGDTQSVSVTLDDNLIEFVDTKVEDGKFILSTTESYSSDAGMKVNITVPQLRRVEVYGAGTANISNYSGDKLAIDVSGAATVKANGKVDSVDVEASGACSLNLLELEAKSCSVDMSGAGSAKVTATEHLVAKLSGVGSLKYKGDPEVNEQVSGIGSVSKIQ